MSTENKKITNARRALRFAHFSNDIYASFVPTVMPILIREFGLSLASAGFYSSFYALMSAFLQPLFGVLTDKTKTRAFVIWGPAITGIFISLTGWITEIWQILPLLFIASIGTASFHPQGVALAGSLAKKDSDHSPSIAKFLLAGTIGASFSSYLAYILLGTGNNLQNLIYASPVGIIGGLAVAATVPNIKIPSIKKRFRTRLWKLKALPLTLVTLTVIFRSIVVSAFLIFLPEFFYQEAEAVGHSSNLIIASGNPKLFLGALSILLIFSSMAIGSLIGGYAEKKFGASKIMIFSFLMSMPIAWYFVETKSLVILVAFGIVVNLSQAITISLAQKLIPENAATASSLTMGFGWGLATLLMPAIGHYADIYGLARALEINALIFLLCAILTILILKRDKNYKKIA